MSFSKSKLDSNQNLTGIQFEIGNFFSRQALKAITAGRHAFCHHTGMYSAKKVLEENLVILTIINMINRACLICCGVTRYQVISHKKCVGQEST